MGCEFCGYYLCSKHLNDHPTHEIECKLFKEKGYKLSNAVREYDMETAYPLIAPLRCLRLKETSPESWRIIKNLMDHREERIGDTETYIEPYRLDVIDKLVHELQYCTEEEALEVIGFLDVNSMAVRGGDGAYRGRGLYQIASLMNHDCICNTRNIITKARLETRAVVPIKAGECITTHYVSPLLPVNSRRDKLRERWFFDCLCSRCSSPTDHGAYTSALRCDECKGFLLPNRELEKDTVYRCNMCGKEQPSSYVERHVQSLSPLVEALKVFALSGTSEEEDLVDTLSRTLHPHHHLILELKVNLARKLGRTSGKRFESANNEVLGKKLDFCFETLGVMKIIYPGLSKYRGLLLAELAESLLILSARLFENRAEEIKDLSHRVGNIIDEKVETEGSKPFLAQLKLCQAVINEGRLCLELDSPGTPEKETYSRLDSLLTTVSDLILFNKFI